MPNRAVMYCALTLWVLSASPAPVRAAPVVFDNAEGQFRWYAWSGGPWGGPPTSDFHITRGPRQQPAPGVTLALPRLAWRGYASPLAGSGQYLVGLNDMKVAQVEQVYIRDSAFGPPVSVPYKAPLLLSASDAVGPGMDFASSANMDSARGVSETSHTYRFPGGFVGVSFPLSDGTHYGFIHLDRSRFGGEPQPIRWGYESERGVPFAMSAVVPEPSALVLLAATGCVLLRSRRR